MVSKIISLLNNLNKSKLNKLVSEIRNIKIGRSDISKYINFNNNVYTKNLVYRDKHSEIILICWDKNCKTKIHNHPENGCIMKILQGNLLEERYDLNGRKLSEVSYSKNNVGYIHDDLYFHKIINSDEKTISLHIYSPPNFYDD